MYTEIGKPFQTWNSTVHVKTAVGVDAYLHTVTVVTITDILDHIHLLAPVYSSDFQFYAFEAGIQFLFDSFDHPVVIAHPYESVYFDGIFSVHKR